MRGPHPHPWRRRLLRGAVVAVLVVLALAAYDVWRVRSEVDAARTDLRGLDLAAGNDLAGVAGGAADRIRHADDVAGGSPWLSALGVLPGLGTQVEALRDLTGAAASLTGTLEDVAAEVADALDGAETGAGRVHLLATLDEQLDVVRAALEGLEPEADPVGGPVGDARREFDDEVAERLVDLDVAQRRVQAVERLLVGPTRLLVLGGNNAEMSGAAGMPLTASVLDIVDGEFELDDFVPTHYLVPDEGLPPPGDLGDLFPLHGVGFDFRGSTATPNFPSVGPLLVDMSANTTTGPVDGVVLLDSVTVSLLVRAVGSVEVEGRRLGPEAVYQDLVLGNYQRLGQPGDRAARYALQELYAEAVFDEVTAGAASPAALADALADAAATRHLLAWSPDEDLQELFETTGASGRLGPDSFVVAVENMDGNKLDTFIQPVVTLESLRQLDGGHLVTVSVDVPFPKLPPAAQVPYVLGPTPEIHFVQTVFALPDSATQVEVLEAPDRLFERNGRDGESVIHTGFYGIPEGERYRYTIRFLLPPGLDALEVVPSGRSFGQRYVAGDLDVVDSVPFAIPLDPPPPEISDTERGVVVAGGIGVLLAALVTAARSAGRRRRTPVRWVEVGVSAGALALCLAGLAVAA